MLFTNRGTPKLAGTGGKKSSDDLGLLQPIISQVINQTLMALNITSDNVQIHSYSQAAPCKYSGLIIYLFKITDGGAIIVARNVHIVMVYFPLTEITIFPQL